MLCNLSGLHELLGYLTRCVSARRVGWAPRVISDHISNVFAEARVSTRDLFPPVCKVLVRAEDAELVGYIGFEDASLPPYFGSHNDTTMDDESPFFSCRFCPFSTDSSKAVAQHLCIRMSTCQGRSRMGGERPYRCGFCSSAFYQRAHLDGHILTHTGEKPFRCAICEQAFSRKSNMLRHMKTHNA